MFKLAKATQAVQAQRTVPTGTGSATRKAGKLAEASEQNPALPPSDAILADLHGQATDAGETWIVFGTNAARTGAVRVRLDLIHKRGTDGRLSAPELAAVEPCTGTGKLIRTTGTDAVPVSHGTTVQAPTGTGDGRATACTTVWIVGDGIAPTTGGMFPTLDLTTDGRGNRWTTGRYANLTTTDGSIWSADVQVLPARAGDTWEVLRARIYTGGRKADTDGQITAMYGIAPIDPAAVQADARKAAARKAAATRKANAVKAAAKAETDALPGVPSPVKAKGTRRQSKAAAAKAAAAKRATVQAAAATLAATLGTRG